MGCCCCSNSLKSEEKKSLLDNDESQVVPKNGSWFDEDKVGSIECKNISEPQQPLNIPKHRRHSSRVSASGDIVENIMKTLQLEPDQKSLAIRAVLASHNESQQAATEWINQHKYDKDANKPITEKFKCKIQNEMEQELISKVTQKIDDKHLKFKTESKDKDIIINDNNKIDKIDKKKKKDDDIKDKETMNEILSNWNTEIIIPFKSNNLIKDGCFIDNEIRLNKCYHVQRVIFILQIYDEWRQRYDERNNFSSSLTMIDMIESLPSYSIIDLMNDFLHLNECHNYNDSKYETLLEFVTTNLGSCVIGICDHFARNYRDKEICDKDDKERKNTYFGYLDSDSVYLCQILDCIHCLVMHSDKNGYKMRQKLIQQIRNNADDDEQKEKEENVINIDSRFITMILKNKKKGDIGPLQIGERFYFWESYKTQIDEKYFNVPKYDNLRQEMFENGLYRISHRMWNDTLQKARKWKQTLRGKQFIAKDYENMCDIYVIPALSPISVSHLMSMLFYTNYEYLQYKFKNDGCCNNLDFEILKQNNIEIGWWYKLFTESICLYGDASCQQYKNQTIYYHALNKQTLFSNFNPIFNAPISTTTSCMVIQNAFNLNKEIEGNGIILSLQQNSMSLNDVFMDCSFMSDFPLNKEIIFYSSKSLYIVDIMEIHSEPSEYINGFLLFHCIFNGKYFIDNCHNTNYLDFQSSLLSMIDNEIKNENEFHVKIDGYIQS